MKEKNQNKINEQKFYINGMHCPSCELLIEKKLLKEKGVESVDVSLQDSSMNVCSVNKLEIGELNKKFKDLGYSFSEHKVRTKDQTPLFNISKGGGLEVNVVKLKKYFVGLLISLAILFAFFQVEKLNLGSKISVDSNSSLYGFLLFGLVAGTSSCAALVGGVLLSMTKQWNEIYIDSDSVLQKSYPHLMFHLGRLISYLLLGGLLGLVGSLIKFSLEGMAVLTLFVSVAMVILGLQMLGVKWAQQFRIRLPDKITRFAANEDNFRGKAMPFLTGFATFFLPCGFTLVAQSVALSSGSFLKAALIMFVFAVGTLPTLGAISFSGVHLNKKPHLTAKFNYIAGLLVVFFAIYNINAQLNLLGLPSLSDLAANDVQVVDEVPKDNPVQVGEEQVLKVVAKDFDYIPKTKMELKVGVPAVLEVDNQGIRGCGAFMAARGLFEESYYRLVPGLNTIKFTPKKAGTYKLTCSMGMVPPVNIKVI